MDDYLSEREQIDRVRKWVRENAPWALAGILIGVAALVGWQQWQNWQERKSLSASQKYEQAIESLANDDREGATKLATQLKADYASTPYGDMAELALARFHVEEGKYAEAAKYLADVMDTSEDAQLQLVARLRLARVQRADGKLDEALATLNGAQPGGYAPAFAVVRGDVLLEKGDRAGALAAYREAMAAKDDGQVDRELLQLKINDAGGGVEGGVADAAAPAGATAATAGTASAGGAP